MRCAIWYHLRNLKNVKKYPKRGTTVMLEASACDFIKSNTPLWMFFTFFNLHKWYQIAQRIRKPLFNCWFVFKLFGRLFPFFWKRLKKWIFKKFQKVIRHCASASIVTQLGMIMKTTTSICFRWKCNLELVIFQERIGQRFQASFRNFGEICIQLSQTSTVSTEKR